MQDVWKVQIFQQCLAHVVWISLSVTTTLNTLLFCFDHFFPDLVVFSNTYCYKISFSCWHYFGWSSKCCLERKGCKCLVTQIGLFSVHWVLISTHCSDREYFLKRGIFRVVAVWNIFWENILFSSILILFDYAQLLSAAIHKVHFHIINELI